MDVSRDLARMSLVELTKLEQQIAVAKSAAQVRARNEVKEKIAQLAAKSGFKLSDLYGVKAARSVGPKWRDPKTGVLWSGRGRPPLNFDRSAAVAI